MKVWVAYNDFGDLVADAYSYQTLAATLDSLGYAWDEVIIGTVTP